MRAQNHFAMAHLMRATGDPASAGASPGPRVREASGSRIVERMFLLTDASFAFDRGDEEAAVAHLGRPSPWGRRRDTFFSGGAVLMLALCAKALGRDRDGARQNQIRVFKLTPDEPRSGDSPTGRTPSASSRSPATPSRRTETDRRPASEAAGAAEGAHRSAAGR
jgi:hypothetical protein